MKDSREYPQKDTDYALVLMHSMYELENKLLKLSPIKRHLFHHDEAYELIRTYRDIMHFTNPVVQQVFSIRKGNLYF